MFTGIVEELGRLIRAEQREASTRLVFGAELVIKDCKIGDSIAVNGCCLTVVELGTGSWSADAVPETIARTNLGYLSPGDRVNLERPVTLATRLGGHLVQGHIDGIGTVLHSAPDLRVEAPRSLCRFFVPKGSVTVDGASLTVVEVFDGGFSVAIIPHTSEVTTLGRLRPGDLVNLEVDVIAKYVDRLVRGDMPSPYRREPAGEVE